MSPRRQVIAGRLYFNLLARHAHAVDSDLPPALPAGRAEETAPQPVETGGVNDSLAALVPAAQRTEDELDHVGLDYELPEEDQAHR